LEKRIVEKCGKRDAIWLCIGGESMGRKILVGGGRAEMVGEMGMWGKVIGKKIG